MTAAARKRRQVSKPDWLNTDNVINVSSAVLLGGFTTLEAYLAVIYFAAGGWYILGGLFFTAATTFFAALLWQCLQDLLH